MKKTSWRELLLGALSVGMCKVTIMGCYPLIPAYFAAVYLEETARKVIIFATVFGMLLFLPMEAIARYGMAILVILTAIHLAEWTEKKKYTLIAGVAAGAGTSLITIGGQYLDISHRVPVPFAVAEGVFIFGFVLFTAKELHIFLTPLKKQTEIMERTMPEPEKLQGYAKIFDGLARNFSVLGQEKIGNAELSEELTLEYGQELNLARLNQTWYNRLVENRKLIAEQMSAMAYLIEDCAQQKKVLDKTEKKMLENIRYLGKEAGFEMQEIHLYEKKDTHLQMLAVVRSRQGKCIASKKLAEIITEGMEISMRPHEDTKTFIGRDWLRVIFEESPKYHEIHGIARKTRDGASISGDSFSVIHLEDGSYYAALSDGMGSGSVASQESGRIIDMLEKFVEAGFELEKAIRLMNASMVFQTGRESFSTLDAARIDLFTGETHLYKVGAAATFIRHKDGSVEALLSTSLPIGATCDLEVEHTTRVLGDGDFLVMITDGVLEYLRVPKPEEKMEEMIGRITTNHPGLMAKQLLEHVLLFTGGRVPDDMTIFVTALWEKK